MAWKTKQTIKGGKKHLNYLKKSNNNPVQLCFVKQMEKAVFLNTYTKFHNACL